MMITNEKLIQIKKLCESLEQPLSRDSDTSKIISTYKDFKIVANPEVVNKIVEELIAARETLRKRSEVVK